TCNNGRICFQPQSDICSLCFCVAWAIFGIPQLDFVGLPGCWLLAVPPSSIARRGIPKEALWPRVCGVLQSSKEISLSAPYVEEMKVGLSNLIATDRHRLSDYHGFLWHPQLSDH